MAIEKFEVLNRFTGDVQFTADIDPPVRASRATKLGLAVRWAIEHKANLSGANLSRANLSRANLSRANLSRANLSRANLSRANLSGASLSWADLSRASLSGANLSWANLSWANLSWANLSGANLSGADLSGADLLGADLSGADLLGADLSRANLSRADLSRADLSGALVNSEKIKRLFASAQRYEDFYAFFAFELEAGGAKIMAGCRWFTPSFYIAHVAATYPDTAKATETLAIIDFFEMRACQLGITVAD